MRHHTIDGERVDGRVDDGDDGDGVGAHLQLRPPLGRHRRDLSAPVDGGFKVSCCCRFLAVTALLGLGVGTWQATSSYLALALYLNGRGC
jgi:hypothetical protein